MTASAASPSSVSATRPRTCTIEYGFSCETAEIATRGSSARLRALRVAGCVKKAIRLALHAAPHGHGVRRAAREHRRRRGSGWARGRTGARSSSSRPCGDTPTGWRLPDEIRAACARVAAAARHVRIADDAVAPYAATLAPALAAREQPYAEPERGAAHLLQLDAVNFGSGWFPTLRKPPGPLRLPHRRARPARARARGARRRCGASTRAECAARRSARSPSTR